MEKTKENECYRLSVTENRVLKPFIDAATRPFENDVVTLSFEENQVKTCRSDKSNVALVSGGMPEPVFDEYNVPDFDIDFWSLNEVLGNTKKTDSIKLSLLEDKTVVVETDGEKIGECRWGKTIHEEITVPEDEVGFEKKIKLPAKKFKRIVRGFKKQYKHIDISLVDNELFCQWSHNGVSLKTRLECRDIEDLDSESDKMKSVFSLDYLRDMTLGIDRPRSSMVEISFGHDKPLKMEFGVGDEAWIQYMLAPQICDNPSREDMEGLDIDRQTGEKHIQREVSFEFLEDLVKKLSCIDDPSTKLRFHRHSIEFIQKRQQDITRFVVPNSRIGIDRELEIDNVVSLDLEDLDTARKILGCFNPEKLDAGIDIDEETMFFEYGSCRVSMDVSISSEDEDSID